MFDGEGEGEGERRGGGRLGEIICKYVTMYIRVSTSFDLIKIFEYALVSHTRGRRVKVRI